MAEQALVPQELWRARLALAAAEVCAALVGRREGQGALRDAVLLTRAGDDPGPAGRVLRQWSQAVARPVSVGHLEKALVGVAPEQIALCLDAAGSTPVERAAAVIEAVLTDAPRAETAALILAEAVLARSLRQDHLRPVLALGLKPRDLRLRGDDLRLACHRAVVAGVGQALPLAGELSRGAGRRATTHWAFAPQLAERFPKVHLADEHMVMDEGDIMTAGGILAWADLGLTLVGRLLGSATMLATARFLLIEPPRQSQLPFAQFIPRFDHGDDAIRQSQHQIHARAATLHGVTDLADKAGMTGRTFLRRFSAATGFTPVAYLQQVRIAKAREALERTQTPVDRIGWEVGYADPAAFRKLFQKLTGIPPSAYRQKFGIAAG